MADRSYQLSSFLLLNLVHHGSFVPPLFALKIVFILSNYTRGGSNQIKAPLIEAMTWSSEVITLPFNNNTQQTHFLISTS